ncbi:inhibitor of growth protein 3 [Penicillium digitatum]|uniref:Uncharacterized protein n=3 Tax=Penicillium digitatum TaxID=36651 RepID=K9G9L5_PEND2|nr:hypothetical protein PDIP_40510 [Penicillium digitatum Pd1]EKV15419.1 hypothetical protein PDIP_40510 [Penicillium digitatum Pd1]EKV17762.1 hypothetical protein PDIG_13380 [Penicillium digitatum PHI26]KAG0155510.1 hypothetical protein PDIDSM_1087 [Penicillium digitatum]QQK46568.1 inhibitor of growth protein 3 [Penicillium digitatum]
MSAEHTRDWSTLLPTMKPTGQIDQAFDLPETGCFVLYQFPCVLEHPSHYVTWRNSVCHILKMHRLHRLIDSGIARPYKDSPNAQRWQQMSIEVRNWIAWNMNPILVRMIVKEEPRAELADEFMVGADTILLQGHTRSPVQDFDDVSAGLFNLIRCRRDDYSSIRLFVHRLMEYYTHTLNLKMGIPPFVPLLILLHEIEGDVGTAFVKLRYDQLDDLNNITQDVTKAYFEDVYFDVLEHLELMGQTPRDAHHPLTE